MFSEKKPPRQPVLLVAGCGDLGMRVAQERLQQGWAVYGLRRQAEQLGADIQPITGDLTQPQQPQQWPQTQIDFVLYAVAAKSREESVYRQVYLQGLQHLLQWLDSNGQRPKRVFFVSSTAVYGQDDGSWVDETSPTVPRGFNGKVMLEAEQWLASQAVEHTLVRLSGLYGGQRQALLNRVLEGYQVAEKPVHFSNRIHVEDAAGLLSHLLATAAQGNELEDCYIGVDDQPVAQAEVVSWLREQLQVRQVKALETVRGVGSKRCSNARARASGWQPRYPSYKEGYRERLARFTQ